MSKHTAKVTVFSTVVRSLTDEQLVANLNALNEGLDSMVAIGGKGYDPETDPDFKRDVKLRNALRAEYRDRTGEVI